MWPFKDNKKTEEKSNRVESKQSYSDLSVLNHIFKDKDMIESELKQVFDFDQFQSDRHNDQGNYFGVEFDIKTTVSRMKSLYLREPWIYAISSLIARTLSNINFQIVDKNTEDVIESHDGNEIVNGGNYFQDPNNMKVSGGLDLVLGGNQFLVTDEEYKKVFQVPVELVSIIPRELNNEMDQRFIEQHGPIEKIQIFGESMGFTMKDIPYEQVIHMKLPNPYNPFFGLSMFAAAARPILLDRYKNEFELAFYLKGATNAGVIETQQDITRSRMDRLMRTFEQAFTGKRNWWRTLFLPKGAVWKNSGLTMAEMQHLEGLRENRRTLLAMLGVPPSQVGIVEDVNRSTSEVQERAFWLNTIVPLVKVIEEGWNNSYLFRVVYGDTVKVKADLSGIEALEGSLYSKGEIIDKVKAALLINEIRTDILGYPPLKETDPRGNMFVSEISPKVDIFGASPTSPAGDLGPEDEQPSSEEMAEEIEKAIIFGNTDDGLGEYRHIHTAQWDREKGDGTTLDTLGDGPKHIHEIKEFRVKPSGEDNHSHPDLVSEFKAFKKAAQDAQENIEKVEGDKYNKALYKYIKAILKEAKFALEDGRNVKAHLITKSEERIALYVKEAMPVLWDTLNKAYVVSMTTTKRYKPINTKGYNFSDEDEQALDAIRMRTQDEQRKILADRSLERFRRIDETKIEQVMQLIEDGIQAGKTQFEIAKELESEYLPRYGGNAAVISRTEVLSAVSQGIEWNHQSLNRVFIEVKKQWFHVGDSATNPDARKEHAAFEKSEGNGIVPSSYKWVNPTTGASLAYPRDPTAGAADVVNCRCTMVSVIPDNATSRASTIINQ